MNKTKLVSKEDLPVLEIDLFDQTHSDFNQIIKSSALSVFVDDYPAHIFIRVRSGFMSNEKVVIIFEEIHERWPEGFQTKYFMINTPGILVWGHNNEKMILRNRD